jgi:hypothetical protein
VLWLVIIAAIVLLLFMLAAMSRRAKQRAAVRGLRQEFPRIAYQRLVGSFPDIEPAIGEPMLRSLFDWMLCETYRRTNTSGFGDLMRWEIENGSDELGHIIFKISEEAVGKLPAPARKVIDGADGRIVAALVIENSLTEAGARIAPRLERDYV